MDRPHDPRIGIVHHGKEKQTVQEPQIIQQIIVTYYG
jgi:hypothetical protein